MASHQGGCFCGSVRYQLSADAEASMVCHCNSCRKLSGAPVLAWISVPVYGFEFIKGRPQELHSSKQVSRWFCGDCGTHMAYQHQSEPEYIDVTTCTLDKPETFPPGHHSWLQDNLSWVKNGDDLPCFQQSRNQG
ncbi:GFA family protein [Neptunicella marina]|uniref:GFA family protein n=1 Tax=Neptunicella marina TaxID=2125989 RepID=A0A8J6M2E2_9ALTE|nr:GFA family protein [Neptunicella marina]MBC3766147.1 GFA family protein [Neptunicella marina]